MARTSKRGGAELRWQRLGMVVLLVAAIAGLTVGYVMQRRAHDALGQQIKSVEREIEWAADGLRREQQRLERLRRKDALLARAAQMGLELSDIVSTQRVSIPLLVDAVGSTSLATAQSNAPTLRSSAPLPLATAGGATLRPPR